MRDLDQLRERGDETTGRRLGLFAMAGTLSVAAVFAMGLMLGRSDAEAPDAELDPLAQLVLSAPASPAAAPEPAEGVKPESLSFPTALLDRGEREAAMVEASVRAAAAEHAALSGERPAEIKAPSVADLPAVSLATEDSERLERAARHDPLIAQTLPKHSAHAAAPVGHEGAFTLQVVSYADRGEAEDFASALRARGHKAFVAVADVPGRGRFHRVRVGPFNTRQEAISYQAAFEGDEHMHTILVSNGAK